MSTQDCAVHVIRSRPGPQVRGEVVNTTVSKRTRYSWCEGCVPIRGAHGKPPTSYVVHMTMAEASGIQLLKCEVPRNSMWTVHPVRLTWATRLLVCRLPATCLLTLVAMRCKLVLQLVLLVLPFFGHNVSSDWDCSGCLLVGLQLRECGVIRCGLYAPAHIALGY